MLRKPSLATLSKYWPDDAKRIRQELDNCGDTIHSFIETLKRIDRIIDGFGVESIRSEGGGYVSLHYVNNGQTYDATLCFDGNFIVCSWGDWLESKEKRGYHFA